MNRPTVLVTGATGNTGRQVIGALARRGVACRAAVRSINRTAFADDLHISLVKLDYSRPETFAPALEGCSGLFLVRPPAISNVGSTLIPFINEAVRLGVGHIVFLSVAGAESNRFIPHRKVEDHLLSCGLRWNFLRAGFFAQNIGTAYRADIVDDNRIFVPAGNSRVAFVDTGDLAEVAAAAFVDPSLANQAWHLTGGESVTFEDVASILTDVLDRPIHYRPAGALAYLMHVRQSGAPFGQAVVQTILHTGLRRGAAETVDPTLGRLLDRPPRTVRDYVEANADLWRR